MSARISKEQAKKLGIDVPADKSTVIFDETWIRYGIVIPFAEYRFHILRKWMFDYAWPEKMTALEIEGGLFGIGKPCPTCKRRKPAGHTSIERLKGDMEKYNAASALGWKVFRCTPDHVKDGSIFALLKEVLSP